MNVRSKRIKQAAAQRVDACRCICTHTT